MCAQMTPWLVQFDKFVAEGPRIKPGLQCVQAKYEVNLPARSRIIDDAVYNIVDFFLSTLYDQVLVLYTLL